MITIVMGPPCAGKSTFIKKNFPDAKVIDLFDYQKDCFTKEDVWHSYEVCAEELQKAIKENEDVVLEHTLLRAIRRKYYIDKIREVTDEDINIVCIIPSQKVLKERCEKRKTSYNGSCLDILEKPKKKEGFSEITIITIK